MTPNDQKLSDGEAVRCSDELGIMVNSSQESDGVIGSLSHDYRVGCLTEPNDDEMFDYPVVYLVISATAVFGHVDDAPNEVLNRFGFPVYAQANDA